MRRMAARLLCALACLALLVLPAAAEGEEATIDKYAAQCVVDAGGQAVMTVTVEVTFAEAATTLDFPVGAGVNASVSGLESLESVQTDDGTVLRYTDETGVSGKRTFVITYTLPKAITAQEGGQRLDLELIAPGWQWPMTEAAFAVAMPAPFTGEPVYVGSYYADLVDDYMDLQSDGNTFSGLFKEPLRDHDSLSVSLDLPEDYADLAGGGISTLAALILTASLALLAVGYWFLRLHSAPLTVRPRPLPPDGAGAGELPFLAGRGEPSLALQAMQWACMGYLSVHVSGDRVVLRQTMAMGNERSRQEKAVFDQLFSRDPWCDGEGTRFGRLALRYADMAENRWRRRIYAKRGGAPALVRLLAALGAGVALLGCGSAGLLPGPARGWLLALLAVGGVVGGYLAQSGVAAALRRDRRGAVLLILLPAFPAAGWLWGGMPAAALAAALQCFAGAVAQRGGRYSARGRETMAQTLGFRRYLQHVSAHQLSLQLRRDSQFFYEMLPFAEAVGQGRDFARRFGGVAMEPCAWFAAGRKPPAAAEDFYRRFSDALRRMEDAKRRA